METEVQEEDLKPSFSRMRAWGIGFNVFISVVSVQESVQGWMALINRKRPGHEQVHAYARFQNCLEALTTLTILPFDESAARLFEKLNPEVTEPADSLNRDELAGPGL